MGFIQKIQNICTNAGYATIIAAIIAAAAAIGIAIYNKNKKGTSDSSTTIIIPPPPDPLSGLKSDVTGIKDIDDTPFNSIKYVNALATRLEILKNPKSQIDVFWEEEDDD